MKSTSGNVTLRQVAEEDMPFLFRLFVDPSRCHLWMQGRQVYDERDFDSAWSSWTAGLIGAKFIVQRGNRPIGLVFEYNRSLEDGYTKATALLDENTVGQGSGVLATTMLINWLFRTVPLRKVYLEVYGYNPRVIRILRKLELNQDAVLREHRFWDGRYWDLHTFTVHRADAQRIHARLLRERPGARNSSRSLTPAAAPTATEFAAPTPHDCAALNERVLVATA